MNTTIIEKAKADSVPAASTGTNSMTPDSGVPAMCTDDREHRFSFFLAPARQVKPYALWTVEKAASYIMGNMSAWDATRRLREIADPKERRIFKSQAFAFCTFSGEFSYRTDKLLVRHSGLLCIDFDHLGCIERVWETKHTLIADPNFRTVLAFTSPSGDGLKWVIEIDIRRADHKTWFHAVANYVRRRYRLEADPQCANVSRACFLPFDEHCWS